MIFKLGSAIFQPAEFRVEPYAFDKSKASLTVRSAEGIDVHVLDCTVADFEAMLNKQPLVLDSLMRDVTEGERASLAAVTYLMGISDVGLAQFVNKYPQYFNQILSGTLPMKTYTYVLTPFLDTLEVSVNSKHVQCLLEFIEWYDSVTPDQISSDFSTVVSYANMRDYASLYQCGVALLRTIMSGNTAGVLAPII